MIIIMQEGNDRVVFDNVTKIEEIQKPSILGGTRSSINLWSGDEMIEGGDDINLMDTILTPLPNAERNPSND